MYERRKERKNHSRPKRHVYRTAHRSKRAARSGCGRSLKERTGCTASGPLSLLNGNIPVGLNGGIAVFVIFPAIVEHQRFYLTYVQNGIDHAGICEINHVLLIFKSGCGCHTTIAAAVLHADTINFMGHRYQFIPAFPVLVHFVAGADGLLSDFRIQQDHLAVTDLGIGFDGDAVTGAGQSPLQFPVALNLWNGRTCLLMALDINAVKGKDDFFSKIPSVSFIEGDIVGILHTSIICDPIQNHRLKFVISRFDRLTSGSIDPFIIFVSGGAIIKSAGLTGKEVGISIDGNGGPYMGSFILGQIKAIDPEDVTKETVGTYLNDMDGMIVPGGFGVRGTEGKI